MWNSSLNQRYQIRDEMYVFTVYPGLGDLWIVKMSSSVCETRNDGEFQASIVIKKKLNTGLIWAHCAVSCVCKWNSSSKRACCIPVGNA